MVAGSLPLNALNFTKRVVRFETTSDFCSRPITTGTSKQYIQRLALVNSRASVSAPLTIAFEGEKLKPPETIESLGPEGLRQILYDGSVARLTAKVSNGAFIAEAGDFAAAACWEPESIREGPRADMSPELAAKATRPIFAEFTERVEVVKQARLRPVAERMSQGRFWHLNMLARDPGVPYVQGAVRAVLVPFLERFTSEDGEGGPAPIWLETDTERARSIYAHFGFREVGAWEVRGVKIWAMMYTREPEFNPIENTT
ncbi:hypothetical protein SLS62_007343 [Diatrype stigma]|uniref:N-acetyltransferase domain-containing protein n=1 Tax=Diatrype stigma TaxID=117547 RepID=A0AAN9UR58_9PEZI